MPYKVWSHLTDSSFPDTADTQATDTELYLADTRHKCRAERDYKI